MKISRQIGTTNEVLNVFINDATVSTGAGLANVVASSVSFAWFRSDQAAVSTGTCTTGTLGTFGVSSFVQALSNGALGWYQFSPPNGIFASGKSAAIHLSGAPNMAPLPIEIELTKTDNQNYVSTQPFNIGSVLQSPPVTSAAGVLSVNELTILGSTPVTNSAGVYSVDLKTIYGTAPVTTAAGILATVFDLGRTANPTSTVAFTGVTIASSQNVSTITDKANFTLSAAYDFAKGTAAMTESYAADGATMTPVQALYQLWGFAAEKNVNTTTMTIKKLDGATTAMVFTLDSSTAPTSLTRAS